MPNRISTVATASLASVLRRLQSGASGPCTGQVKGNEEVNMRKAAIRTVAPAALATVLLVLASGWDAAQSKPTMNPCQKRWDGCAKRCLGNNIPSAQDLKKNYDPGMACLERTCNKQLENCNKANPKSPQSSPSPKAEGGPGAKQDYAKPKKGISGTPSGQWVPNSPAKGKGVPSVPAGGTWTPSPSSGAKGTILRSSGGRR